MKKRRNRFLAVVLTAMMLTGLLPTTSLASEGGTASAESRRRALFRLYAAGNRCGERKRAAGNMVCAGRYCL